MVLGCRYRFKDVNHRSKLKKPADPVNFVWNSSCEIILKNLTEVASRDLDINSQTIQAVACGDSLIYDGFTFRLREQRHLLAGAKIKAGSFAEDSRGADMKAIRKELARP